MNAARLDTHAFLAFINISSINGTDFFYDVSRAAAAVALEAEEVPTAVDWLEKGRCIAWNQLNGLRTPIEDLRSVDKELADEVERVGKALEDPTQNRYMDLGGMEFRDGEEVRAPSYVKATIEWKALVSKVKEKMGFENFAAVTSVNMQDLPIRGTVVVINVHEMGCSAIALRAGWTEPHHIPLPAFSLSKTVTMVERLRSCLHQGGVFRRGGESDALEDDGVRALALYRRRPREYGISGILRDLWECIVCPVLQAIGYLSSDLPSHRIWWCPTGPLAFLPLHAAGMYDGPRSAAADFVISSYVPNVGALIRAKGASEHFSESTEPSQMLVVSLPITPDHTPLPGATREVETIRDSLNEAQVPLLHLEGEQAVTGLVMSNLASCPSVHFACHAFQHPEEPLKSGFLLHNGSLALSEIVKQNNREANLAYLSACQTSVGDEKLSEEAMHLAAGMLAAGYRGVVATMWSIKDRYAPDVAKEFYGKLSKLNASEGRDMLGAEHAAEALHFAIARLRAELGDKEDALLTWVPYVHFGI